MKVEVKLPQIGESITEGTLLKWLKKTGDRVEKDEVLFEISTDKVDSEIPSPASGVLSGIIVSEGETVAIGAVIGYIETEAVPRVLEDEVTPVPRAPKVEGFAKSAPEVTVGTAHREPGSAEEHELELEEQGPLPSGSVGIAEPGPGMVQPETDKLKPIPAEKEPAPPPTPKTEGDGKGRFYSPLVLRIAQEEGISPGALAALKGSGIGGRVTKRDILSNIESLKSASVGIPAAAPADAPVPAPPETREPGAVPSTSIFPVGAFRKRPAIEFSEDGISAVPMDTVRTRIAEHMLRSVKTSPHVTSVSEADVTGLVNYRQRENPLFMEREKFSLNYTAFTARALVLAVQDFPELNASLEGNSIIYKKWINLGIAVALENGLIVPVIKKAEEKNIVGLARAIYDISTRARSKKLLPEEVQDSTISITNFGSFGSLFGTPIINQPNVAILGVGAIKKRPEVVGEGIAIREMMYVSVTYDHRLIDGAVGGMFLNKVIEYLENVESLL